MYYNDEELEVFEDFADNCGQSDMQRQFAFCMMMDQIVRTYGE